MPWVKGIVSGRVTKEGEIIAETRNLQVMTTPKSADREAAIGEGLDANLLERVCKERKPGMFKGVAHFGGATAILVPWAALAKLDERRMARLLGKYYGYMERPAFPEWVAIMHVRNTGAPAQQNCAEPSGGMASSLNLLADQVSEMVETGIYCDKGWVRFRLPDTLSAHQEAFDREQTRTWQMVHHGLPQWYEEQLELISVGRDQLNGQTGIVTAGPVGDVAFTCVARLHLVGTGWKFIDLETHNGVPMRRKMVAIAPRPGRSPAVFALSSEGALDDFGHHFVLDGENRELSLTNIGRAVLEALGWLPEEKR